MKWKSVALLFALAALIAGCGGDDSSSDGDSSSAPTTAEFVEEANAACAEYNEQLDELPPPPGAPGTPAFDTYASEEIIPVLEAQINAVDELTPPEADEDTVAAILAEANEGLAIVKTDPSALTRDAFAEANELANDYGLTECGG